MNQIDGRHVTEDITMAVMKKIFKVL